MYKNGCGTGDKDIPIKEGRERAYFLQKNDRNVVTIRELEEVAFFRVVEAFPGVPLEKVKRGVYGIESKGEEIPRRREASLVRMLRVVTVRVGCDDGEGGGTVAAEMLRWSVCCDWRPRRGWSVTLKERFGGVG